MDFGTQAVTSPAPTFKAANDVIDGAPDLPTEPPTTNTCPNSPLFASRNLSTWNQLRYDPAHSIFKVGSIASSGVPIAATTMGPRVIGADKWACFAAVKVTTAS